MQTITASYRKTAPSETPGTHLKKTVRAWSSLACCIGSGSLALALLPGGAFAQSAPSQSTASQNTSQPSPASAQDIAAPSTTTPDGAPTYATGKPLEQQSHEGFFGHLNPFARKKWVHRQIDPIADRANELDELQAKNANDIRDVDARSTAGVNRAMTTANTADTHAAAAQSRADQANSLAVTTDGKTTQLNGTVSNLDQYKTVSATSLPFLNGRTALSTKDRATLDTVAASLGAEKGYIVEVEGYSRAGVASSQAMADSVVRYLVTAQNVPIYRIYRTGLGKAAAGETPHRPFNGVKVTVLHNSLAEMNGGGTATAPAGSAGGN
jgi:outer membrane protein OmpA-like peptidoglycan-associated protein